MSSVAAMRVESQDLTGAVRDFATKNGTYVMKQTTVGEYLEMLGLYDRSRQEVTWDAALIHAEFQRAILPIEKNPIKRRMFRDLLRGSTLPPVVLYHREGERPLVVDGLQRSHVQTEGASALLALQRGEQPKKFAREELEEMDELGQKPLPLDEFLTRPVVYQLWRDLEPDELVRLFMVLNVGQQKVSARHLLEVMGAHLRDMFESWGIPLVTERQEKEIPRRRGRRPAAERDIEFFPSGPPPFRFEYLLDGMGAYVARDPHVKTSQLLHVDTPKLALEERVTEIGSELCKSDFVWLCRDLNHAIWTRYKADPKWSIAIQNSDNFFIPLMAALGDARHSPHARSSVEDRKAKLVEIINDSDDPDPLAFSREDSDSLANILASIRSNIGRRQRAVVWGAWRRYFLSGLQDQEYPVDWRTAHISE